MVEFTIKAVKFIINNDTETYSTVKQGESVGAERFIRTLKNKIYKYMTSVSKTVYIEKFNDVSTTIHIIEPLKWSFLM